MIKAQLLTPKKFHNVSAKEYLKETKNPKVADNIENVVFIPPEIGSNGYGTFQITYKTPQLCPVR